MLRAIAPTDSAAMTTALALASPDTRNPAELGYPFMLPMDLALGTDSVRAICDFYGLDKDAFAGIIANPVFVKAYQEAVEGLKVDGASFKTKAKMQAEHYLRTAFKMIENPNTSDAVRADLIKSTVRWAGLDTKAVDAGAAGGSFNIQINLGA